MGQELTVFPKPYPMEKLKAAGSVQTEAGVGGTLTSGAPDEFDEVSEYRTGDDAKRINWKASAKLGKLMLNRFVEKTQSASIIYFDNRVTLYDGDEKDIFEAAVSLVGTIIWRAAEQGLRIGLITPQRYIAPYKGKGHARIALCHLAEITPVDGTTGPNRQPFLRGTTLCITFMRKETGELTIVCRTMDNSTIIVGK